MKSKKLYLPFQSTYRKDLLIYAFATLALIFSLIKVFFQLYLHNPSFHMFIQSKGIFL